jgi:hypothetical protein
MLNVRAVSMSELELESAQLLPVRETLMVARWHGGCSGSDYGYHHDGGDGCGDGGDGGGDYGDDDGGDYGGDYGGGGGYYYYYGDDDCDF